MEDLGLRISVEGLGLGIEGLAPRMIPEILERCATPWPTCGPNHFQFGLISHSERGDGKPFHHE